MRLLSSIFAGWVLFGCDAAVPLPDGADLPPNPAAEAAHRAREGGETEGSPSWASSVVLPDGSDLIQGVDGISRSGQRLCARPAGPVAIDDAMERFAFVCLVDGGPESQLVVCSLHSCVVRQTEGDPDRLAIAPDGSHVAFVARVDGLPAIHLAPFSSGVVEVLTNSGLDRSVPGRPPGFIPPPLDEGLRFEGSDLTWRSDEGVHRVRWR